MIQSNQKFYHRPHPAVSLLASPTHLIFQLIKFTTLPYMICQILNSNKNNTTDTNHHAFSTQPTPPSQFTSPLESTKLFHRFIRQLDAHHHLIHLIDKFLDLTQPPKLNPTTVQHIFAIIRPTMLDRLHQQHQSLDMQPRMQPRVHNSTAWESEAMNQIVQTWYNQSRQTKPSIQQPADDPPADDPSHSTKTMRTLKRLQTRRRAFLLHGPSRCDCQRPPLPPRNLGLDQVGTLDQPTLVKFTQKLDRSINQLTYLRIIDLMRQAQRWDLVVIFLDRTRIDQTTSDPKNRSRRLGQVTALLQYIRDDGQIAPEIDPMKMWTIHFVCESIERNLDDQPYEWARINRLSLDVLTQAASMPIGFDRRVKSHHHPSSPKTRQDATKKQRWPCVNLERHEQLMGAITDSTNELEFAVLTRERCVKLLSKMTRIITLQKSSTNVHPCSTKSLVHLRLLEHLARQGTQEQFMSLLKTHLDQHPTSSKLAKLILLASRRFKSLSENSDLISQALSKCDRQDTRPIIDFMLRPQQPLETLNQNLNICLASLPINDQDARIQTYSHLIYRLSQLSTPSLALRVWEKVNREERSRTLLRVGRRTRHKLRKLVASDGEELTRPIDKLPNQLIRSMVYVYKNLTHVSPKNNHRQDELFARGINYRSLYKRLSLKSKSNRSLKWPITKKMARSHLIYHLIKTEIHRIDGYKLLKSLENSFLSHGVHDDDVDHNSFENLVRFLLVNRIKGSEFHLIKRFYHLESHQLDPSQTHQSLLLPSPSSNLKKLGRKRNNSNNNNTTRLKFFKFVKEWIESRGGGGGGRGLENKENLLIRRSSNPHLSSSSSSSLSPQQQQQQQQHGYQSRISSQSDHVNHNNHKHLGIPRPRRDPCSRYWARIVAHHSSPPHAPSPSSSPSPHVPVPVLIKSH